MSNSTQDAPSFSLAPQQEQLFLLPDVIPVTQTVVRFAEPVSEADLRSALDQVVSRQEILRTTFTRLAGMRVPQQVIHDELPATWTSSVLSGDDRVETLLDSLLLDEAAALDTEQGPILRAVLVSNPDSEQALVLTAPAASLDGVSMILLLRELGRVLRADGSVEDPLQYADYAEWRSQLLDDGGPEAEADAARSWWREESGQSSSLPFFRGSPGSGGVPSKRLPFTLSDEDRRALRVAAGRSRISEALFLEACVHALAARLSGDGELVLAGLVDGRSQPDLAGALGPYAQLVPIRSRVEPGTTFVELVDQVRRARRMPHAGRTTPHPSSSRSPLEPGPDSPTARSR